MFGSLIFGSLSGRRSTGELATSRRKLRLRPLELGAHSGQLGHYPVSLRLFLGVQAGPRGRSGRRRRAKRCFQLVSFPADRAELAFHETKLALGLKGTFFQLWVALSGHRGPFFRLVEFVQCLAVLLLQHVQAFLGGFGALLGHPPRIALFLQPVLGRGADGRARQVAPLGPEGLPHHARLRGRGVGRLRAEAHVRPGRVCDMTDPPEHE